jgi:ABC-type nitrate/sulfonate/bicarbonate transport system ATPase subunit
LLIDNLSLRIPPGAIVGIIGPNGAGKSTLFRMLAGKEQPDSGEITVGSTVRLSLVDQSRDILNDKKTVFDDVSEGADILTVGRFEMSSRAYLGRFNFKGGDQQKLVGNLSGGERGRLHMAKTLLMGGNVLMLDEPSNDLDIETLRALEDLVRSGKVRYVGCSNYAAWQLAVAHGIAKAEGLGAFVGQQIQYSLAVREAEEEGRDERARGHSLQHPPVPWRQRPRGAARG